MLLAASAQLRNSLSGLGISGEFALRASGPVFESSFGNRVIMTSTSVCVPPPPPAAEVSQHMHSIEAPLKVLPFEVTSEHFHGVLGRSSFPQAYSKRHGGMGLVDLKAEPQDVVALDAFVLPVDRGPAVDARLLRSWQYQVTGKAAAAAVLAELKTEHLESGGPQGIKAKACELISQKKLDDTFYVVDLGNTLRMFKAS